MDPDADPSADLPAPAVRFAAETPAPLGAARMVALRAAPSVSEVETPAPGLSLTDAPAFSLNTAAPAQTLVPLDAIYDVFASAHADLRRTELEFKLAAHQNAALSRAALHERRCAEEHERRGRHFELRQDAARAAFEVEQRIADENSARDGQYAAEGDQIRSVELQEQIAQMLAPAALPPP